MGLPSVAVQRLQLLSWRLVLPLALACWQLPEQRSALVRCQARQQHAGLLSVAAHPLLLMQLLSCQPVLALVKPLSYLHCVRTVSTCTSSTSYLSQLCQISSSALIVVGSLFSYHLASSSAFILPVFCCCPWAGYGRPLTLHSWPVAMHLIRMQRVLCKNRDQHTESLCRQANSNCTKIPAGTVTTRPA